MSDQPTVFVATRSKKDAASPNIYFEAIPTPGIPVAMANTGPVAKIEQSFEEICAAAADRVATACKSFYVMANSFAASEVEVKLGIKLTAEGSVVFAKTSAEGSIEVTVKFVPPEKKEPRK